MSQHFSWKEGISMRSIDSDYISPVLRDEGLLKVNRDGVMMTRTLAENYPYSHFYKANLRGARDEWEEVIREVERGNLDPEEALKYLISGLINRGYEARNVQNDVLELLTDYESEEPSAAQVRELFHKHFQNSTHSARLLEVAMHSLFQVADEYGLLDLRLNELGQMRSADKKHGNVADVELSDPDYELHIVKAWDGKYGKGELANDLQELDDKLRNHPETEELTFVITTNGELDSQSHNEKEKMERKHDITIDVIKFDKFCEKRLDTIMAEGAEPSEWLKAYVESLAQKRRDIAPIDEPTTEWLKSMKEILD